MFFKCNYKPLFDVLLEFFKYESVYFQESDDLDKAIQALYGSFRVNKFLRILKNSYPNYYRLVKLYDERYYKYKLELKDIKCRYLYTKEPAYEFIREIYDEFWRTKPDMSKFEKGNYTYKEASARNCFDDFLRGVSFGKQLGDNLKYTWFNEDFNLNNPLDRVAIKEREKKKNELIKKLKDLY